MTRLEQEMDHLRDVRDAKAAVIRCLVPEVRRFTFWQLIHLWTRYEAECHSKLMVPAEGLYAERFRSWLLEEVSP
jgi:hypothetical protein